MRRAIIFTGIIISLGFILCTLIMNRQLSMAQSEEAPAAGAAKASYIGIDKCKICHSKNADAFYARNFEKSWKILKMRGKDKDAECVVCHTTGYGQPSGFVSEEATSHLKYKQCEACHGPGSLHSSDPSNKEYRKTIAPWKYSNDNICIQCHVCMKQHKELSF